MENIGIRAALGINGQLIDIEGLVEPNPLAHFMVSWSKGLT